MTRPLDRFELFHSRDLDVTRDQVGRIFGPHRVELAGRETRLDARMHSKRLQTVGLNYVAYGGAVRIDLGELRTFFIIQAPLRGNGLVQHGPARVYTDPGFVSVLNPTMPLSMRLSADAELVLLRIERTAMETLLSDLLGRSLPWPIEFHPGMDVTTGYARSWYNYLLFCVTEVNRPGGLLTHPLAIRQMERSLLTSLLLAHASNYTALLQGDLCPAPSRAVSQVVDLIEHHPEQSHTMGSLARKAGVSVRALQKGFRRHLDTTPSEYLRTVRLQRAHDELRAAQPDTITVGEVAGRWGFVHLGRFASTYRQRFEEVPSQTLHR
ncbi:AraC family transcriptional regulator [Qaidamihabitans albus]|uniref:AraC family transcriptional regulator n=1 Tax=Qaidamihabitans albus TaxID=2795733 RepID=UPI0018F1B606|nr:AraC family transcriptional regulator [Qaidamihabitans albus]